MALAHDTGKIDFATWTPRHFLWSLDGRVGTITLNRPERKNPLTFESYAELRDLFRALVYADDGEGGGDHRRRRQFLLRRRRARDHRPAGAHAGGRRHAGPARLHPHDRRRGEGDARLPATDRGGGGRRLRRRGRDPGDGVRPAARHRSASKVAFLFARVGLAGADMGACNILPRIIGAGRAAELFYTGRSMDGAEAERWGFFNRLCAPDDAARATRRRWRSRYRRRPELRPRHDQALPAPGMEHGRRRGHRGGGAGAGDLHADQGFRPRLPRLRGEAAARVRRATDGRYLHSSTGRSSTTAHRDFARRLEAWAAAKLGTGVHPHDDVDAECRSLVRSLGRGRLACIGACPKTARDGLDVRTALPRPRNPGAVFRRSPISPSPCRASAPAPITLVRQRRRCAPASCRRVRAARASPPSR